LEAELLFELDEVSLRCFEISLSNLKYLKNYESIKRNIIISLEVLRYKVMNEGILSSVAVSQVSK